METLWKNRRQALEEAHLNRSLRVSGVGPVVETPDGEKLIFCSNDYLGMARSPAVANAAQDELKKGIGAGASRLVSGNFGWHEQLEHEFAAFVKKADSVLFPSGYQANVGAISALAGPDDVIFSDRLCHASIIDGCRLSRAAVEIFEHNDVADLRRLLEKYRDTNCGKMVITEGIFSMDGDMPPLREICDAATDAGAVVYLDEAHSLGILGPQGRGLAASLGLSDAVAVVVGTFGKAVGVSGACVAGSVNAAMLLKSTARSLMFTTASPPALARAVCESLMLIESADDKRRSLYRNIRLFKTLAASAGVPLISSDSPIQPVLIGDARRVMEISNHLWHTGLFVQGIRPPTVPSGTERLRITITAAHTDTQIQRLVNELKRCGAAEQGECK
ncbi:MAG: 8-amino-7-oxononanoate synthase [Deltaproteobacteria bacterium]|nr:8-amino-7-oxononanoate synthase [Deltaproteobacteria bacterium]